MRVARPSDLGFAALLAVGAGAAVGLALAQRFSPGFALLVGFGVAALVLLVAARRPLARLAAVRGTLTDKDRAWLRRHVQLYARAAAPDRERFERDVRIALAEWRFEGVGGVVADRTLTLSVAAGAALLLHGRPDWELPSGRTILFYEGAFDDSFDVEREGGDYDGMVTSQGPVLLSVPAVRMGWARRDGYNVVLHELAHLFDVSGALGADGVPTLMDPGSADAWMQLVREEMRRAKMGRSVLSSYASTNPAELFAVATEQFFERPARLHRHHPRLFDALAAFYALDPTPPGEEGEEAEAEAARASLMSRRWEEPEGESPGPTA